MFRGLFFIVFIINIHTSSCVIEALYETGQQVWKLYTIIDNRELDIFHVAEATERLSDNTIIRELTKQLDDIQESLNKLEEFMGPKEIWRIIKSWPLDASTIRGIETIELFVEMIDQYYEQFNYYRNESCCSRASSEILMKDIFPNVQGYILVIRKFAVNEEKSSAEEEDIIAAISGHAIIHNPEICGTPRIISNILIQLFRMIIIAELKTSTMLAYENIHAYMKNKENGAWQRWNSLAREHLEKQFAIYVNRFSLYMTVTSSIYNRACDPPDGNWTRDKSFFELEKTFQAILFGFKQSNCESRSCNDIWLRKSKQCRPLFHEEPVLRSPADSIAECAYLNQIIACALNSGPYRFQYVNSSELGFLGRNSSCPMDNGQLVVTHIEAGNIYAACVCNSYSSHNNISLLMIESDVKSNRVITGVRFVRKNETLYIQPREGELGPNGYIDEDSQRWIPIPENINPRMFEPINKRKSVFFLDDLTLPINYVLTGIKFNEVMRGNVYGFAIEILGRLFNYKSGKILFLANSMELIKGSNEESGKRLSFTPVSSLFTTLPHKVTPSDTKYISLERSALKEDFGQSTLPLFDAVPITFDIPSPLGGVGMFHKGVEDYAGFISLRVYGINYKEYFNEFKVFHMSHDKVLFNSSFN